MADLTEIITNAVHDAEDGILDPTNSSPDINSDDSVIADTSTEVVAETPAAEPAEEVSPSATAAAEPVAPAAHDLAKELEEMGIKAPVAGQRENRLPYSRVVKIVENARKKLISSHTEALRAEQTKGAAAVSRLKDMDRVDHLINTNPDQYLRMLANINPAYQKFLTPAAPAAAVVPETPATVADPAPKPDAQFPDGSQGYTPEGLQKLLDWQARNIETRVTDKVKADYTKQFGPLKQQFDATQELQRRIPIVRGQIAAAKQTWGALFTPEAESEIAKVLEANPQASFDAAVSHVLVPRAAAQRTAMRAEIIKEMNARPKAAAKAPAAAAVSAAEPIGPRTLEQVIADSIKGLKR